MSHSRGRQGARTAIRDYMLLGTLKGTEESLFYNLWFIFQRFGLLQLLQLGVPLLLIRLVA